MTHKPEPVRVDEGALEKAREAFHDSSLSLRIDHFRHAIETYLANLPTPIVSGRDGFVMVPKEPTKTTRQSKKRRNHDRSYHQA